MVKFMQSVHYVGTYYMYYNKLFYGGKIYKIITVMLLLRLINHEKQGPAV